MKILLVYPYFLEERSEDENIGTVPIGLCCIAALLLHEGYDVEIVNFCRSGGNPQEIRGTVARKEAGIVEISVFNANRRGGIETARVVKEVNPEGSSFSAEWAPRPFGSISCGTSERSTMLSREREDAVSCSWEGFSTKAPGAIPPSSRESLSEVVRRSFERCRRSHITNRIDGYDSRRGEEDRREIHSQGSACTA